MTIFCIFSSLGKVYLNGDLNSRTGDLIDYVEHVNLNRFVSLLDDEGSVFTQFTQSSHDKTVNAFGRKLITLLK